MTKIFTIGRVVIQCGIAKSGFWHLTTVKDGKETKHLQLASIMIVERVRENVTMRGVHVFLGPFSITLGIA